MQVEDKTKSNHNIEANALEDGGKEKKFYKFSPFLFLPCAIFHMIGRILFFISVTMTDVVSVQMLRGRSCALPKNLVTKNILRVMKLELNTS